MSQPDQASLTTQAQAGLRRNAAVVAGGVAGASALALLAVASTAPLLAGGLAPAAVAAWLAGLGGNALAGWLDEWARANLARFDGEDPDREQKLIAQLARDLSQQLALSGAIAEDAERLVQRTDAIRVALGALWGQGEQQSRLLQGLLSDVQQGRVENSQLHNATFSAVRQQAQAILDAQAQGDAALAAQLREVLAAARRAEAAASRPQPAPGGISIGGSVGTFQKVDVSGGAVGRIVAKEERHYAAPPASGAAPAPDEVDDAKELLGLQRQNLAAYRRRAARGDAAAAQQAAQARDEVARLKAQLRGWGQAVADEPGDEG